MFSMQSARTARSVLKSKEIKGGGGGGIVERRRRGPTKVSEENGPLKTGLNLGKCVELGIEFVVKVLLTLQDFVNNKQQDACSGVYSACREENAQKVDSYVQLHRKGKT